MGKILSLQRVAICLGGVVLGFVGGSLTHVLPEWLCGPLRADKAAEWTAVAVSAMAAAVTFAALRVAIRSSNTAISVERELRAAEVEQADSARRRQAGILAGSFVVDLRHIISVCTERSRMLRDPRMRSLKRNYPGVERISTPNLDASGARSDVFDLDDGIAFLSIATMVHRIRKVSEVNFRLQENWSNDMVEVRREALLRNLDGLCKAASAALVTASALCGRCEDSIKSVHVGELAYQGRIKTMMGGFLPGGARFRDGKRAK